MQLQLPTFLFCNFLHLGFATFYIFILQQTVQHLHREDHRTGIDIHTVVLVDRASLCQGLHGLLVEEFPHRVVLSIQEHAVVLSGLHVLLE